jgi:hypothetical protein
MPDPAGGFQRESGWQLMQAGGSWAHEDPPPIQRLEMDWPRRARSAEVQEPAGLGPDQAFELGDHATVLPLNRCHQRTPFLGRKVDMLQKHPAFSWPVGLRSEARSLPCGENAIWGGG